MWEIKRYEPEKGKIWNEFVRSSRNATFLFERGYMDYHSDRFADCSLLAYRKGRLAALLPACSENGTLYSHRGLTYGGWLLPTFGLDCGEILDLWIKWYEWCEENTLETIIYKPLPYIYDRMPSQEDLYILFISGAQLKRTDISSAIDLSANPGFNKLQKRHISHLSDRIRISRSDTNPDSIRKFYKLLTECLEERHSVSPVHSLEEIGLLTERFPENIKIFEIFEDNVLLAAICVYDTERCRHCQYIASSANGREKNALPALIKFLIEDATVSGFRYFDFGISNEKEGKWLNRGLNRQKTSFGASGVAYQQYEINVSSALKSLRNAQS